MQNAQQREYFNLHTSGVGYLSRIRWVTPSGRGRKSEPFLACAISALRGSSDEPDYTYFDLRVSGEEAISLIEGMQEAVDQGRKVCVTFRIADTYAHPYERDVRDPQTRRPTGRTEWTALIKGRLILVYSISVDNEQVYKRQTDANQVNGELQQESHQEAWLDEGRTDQEPLDGTPEIEHQNAGNEPPHNEEPSALRQQRPAPAPRQDYAPRQDRFQPHAPRQDGAPEGRNQPRQATAPAARGHGPSAYGRRSAPHSGAGHSQQRAGHA
ncbi:DUF3577 domain-containing protein [Alicycliphilus denitrificans]|uniref:DUF3577 domain-containing protein n=1 Tax=Alicycliphilus denitrificans TaxID=179636 RepID=UPI00384DFF0C